MLKTARELYNSTFSEENYQKLKSEIEAEFPGELDFRVAESPVFVSKEFKTKLLIAANTVIDLIKKDNFKELTDAAIPLKYCFKDESDNPQFLCIDYGVCANENGELIPELIELQGFPTLFAFQHYLIGKYKKHGSIDSKLSPFFNRLNGFNYLHEIEKVIKGETSKNTILLEAYPEKQRTRIDFKLSQTYWGLDVVCLSKIFKEDNHLYYHKGDEKIRIDRIYNRIIFDEIDRLYPELQSQINILKASDFEWITNPNWYYRVSKYCLPFLKGTYVPESYFLDKLDTLPEKLENFVLKPLYSFAGAGVDLHPTQEKIEKIENKSDYLLQRKVQYSPFVISPTGDKSKAEIRLIYIWPEGASRPKLVTSLARLSKGEMINSSKNQDDTWVGGSAVFYEPN